MSFSPKFHGRYIAHARLVASLDYARQVEQDEADADEDDEDDIDFVQCSMRFPQHAPLSNAAQGGPMPTEIIWMPVGTHAVDAGTPSGGSFSAVITCDHDAFLAVQADFEDMKKNGDQLFIDLDHSDSLLNAAAFVKSFSWDATRGIIAHVEWTNTGENAVRTRQFTSFSPSFAVNKIKNLIEGLLGANYALGGLVNGPAFSSMPYLST